MNIVLLYMYICILSWLLVLFLFILPTIAWFISTFLMFDISSYPNILGRQSITSSWPTISERHRYFSHFSSRTGVEFHYSTAATRSSVSRWLGEMSSVRCEKAAFFGAQTPKTDSLGQSPGKTSFEAATWANWWLWLGCWDWWGVPNWDWDWLNLWKEMISKPICSLVSIEYPPTFVLDTGWLSIGPKSIKLVILGDMILRAKQGTKQLFWTCSRKTIRILGWFCNAFWFSKHSQCLTKLTWNSHGIYCLTTETQLLAIGS